MVEQTGGLGKREKLPYAAIGRVAADGRKGKVSVLETLRPIEWFTGLLASIADSSQLASKVGLTSSGVL